MNSTPWNTGVCLAAIVCLATTCIAANAADDRGLRKHIDDRKEGYNALALKIWELAEMGYLETQSSALLKKELLAAGFNIDEGLKEIPTDFVATFGKGKPIIGILAEYDALPGLSQVKQAQRQPLEDGAAGHGCGHHLFGVASTAAAIAVKDWLQRSGNAGTIRLYGTPAEEGGSGKVYMVRGGLFDDVDAVLHWHPSDQNKAGPQTSNANISAKFRFHGIASHAATSPERGRSALDGVEAMNYMANLMREHVPETARIHYVITKGGVAPNVVPDFAEVYYYVRHPEVQVTKDIFERVENCAKAAALGTGTTVEIEVMHGNYSVLPNETLARVAYDNLSEIGGVVYDAKEIEFAKQLQSTFETTKPLSAAAEVAPYEWRRTRGSTDVGDVSWAVPTMGFIVATWVPGTPGHSWQAVAAGGSSIGLKGMALAAETLALSAADLFQQPELLAKARQEWEKRRGADFRYQPLLGDRQPPLDYRK
jgi:aminobenzoyl-glutamate utilization protein B